MKPVESATIRRVVALNNKTPDTAIIVLAAVFITSHNGNKWATNIRRSFCDVKDEPSAICVLTVPEGEHYAATATGDGTPKGQRAKMILATGHQTLIGLGFEPA